MSWERIRKWKHAVVPAAAFFALLLMRAYPDFSPPWYAGGFIAGLLGLAYITEEIVWNLNGKGRPCSKCGYRLKLRSFSVRNSCPNCGEQL